MRHARIPVLLLALAAFAPGGSIAATPRAETKSVTKKNVTKKVAGKSGPAKRSATAKPPTVKPFVKKPVSAAEKAVAVQIRQQASGPVKAFYAARGFWPLWASDGHVGPEAAALLKLLDSADLDGLSPRSYDVPALRDAVSAARDGDAATVAAAELALSRALARYVSDVRRPAKVGMTYLDAELEPHRLSPTDVLGAAALARSFPDYIAGTGWMSPQYLRLRQLLATAQKADLPPAQIARLRLNLDRARLLPGPWVRHIVVDAASARLFYYQGGKQQGMMRVVAGTADTPTPMLAGMVRYAILDPYWNVPTDLARKRIAPKMLAGATLTKLRFEALSDWSTTATRLDQSAIDWDAVASGQSEVRLRQLPGGANAMGRVKFMFPNDLGIYLHDTPDKALMAKPDRHFSNGCVRLEDAPRLGLWLLGKPLGRFPKRPEQDVALAEPVPVYLTYFTATPTEKGVGFLPDVYGRDKPHGR